MKDFKLVVHISVICRLILVVLPLNRSHYFGSEILKLTIRHPNNYVSVGDIITISNAADIGDISATLINKSHVVYSVNTTEKNINFT